MDHSKELYTKEALSYIPHVLEMLDRSPVSKTYGCFDREFWHYKAKDFPSGMYEECVLTLALVYSHDFPDNIYFNNSRIWEYVVVGINFARLHSHSDGSTDDYYPNEEALGATVFSLYACTEAYILLGLHDTETETFFKKRAEFIIQKKESGTLANHHALAALTLYNVFFITKDARFKHAAEEKIQEVLSYQSPEGWFQEYEGCDPGYLTFTLDFLAKYLQKNPENTELKSALEKAVHFCFLTVHPDGSYGGEYGSRNTSHFMPNGFEILTQQFPEATYIRNMFLKSLTNNTRSKIDDDRIFNHYVYNYIQAFLNHDDSLPAQERTNNYQELFKDAGLFVLNKDDIFLICSLKKGGVFKLYREEILIASDCGFVLDKQSGQKIISQTWNKEPKFSVSDTKLVIKTGFYNYSQILPSPAKQLVFRAVTLLLGKPFSRIIRILLQKILIVSKSPTTAKLERCFSFQSGKITVTDIITATDKFKNIYIPTDFTTIYVASGQAYTTSTLISWHNYNHEVETLNKIGELTVTRKF